MKATILLASAVSLILAARCHASDPPAAHIARIVRDIRADRIERTVRVLVGFGTRNTLSSQDDPVRGIGAARDWLRREFEKIREESGGRLSVSLQSFLQPKAPRVPGETRITNIVAVLGDPDLRRATRIYVVSGHYDSICSSPIDAERDAPGANDDASGTAAVLEMARVMARYRFSAPIVFLAVAGEEQGLLGSTYFAEQAKQQRWPVAAMFTKEILVGKQHGDANSS